jgi:putative ABC transport system permease protein
MGLVYKQLTKQMSRNKVFIALLLLLTILTSLSFFFVMFSIDGNMAELNSLLSLSENQVQYKNALNSNVSLAYIFLVSLVGMTAFVFIMFFYRFFRSNKDQIGCLKSLGFKDKSLCAYFVVFVAFLSTIGALLGLLGGYFLSSILIEANIRTYSVTGIVKGISPISLVIGLAISTLVFCIVAFICYSFVRGKEPGSLIAGKINQQNYSGTLRVANGIVNIIPGKNKFPLRIALRKPLAVLLILVAVMAFSVFVILGQSLNISSQKVFDSQTIGYSYEFDTHYPQYSTATVPDSELEYLDSTVELVAGGYDIEQTIVGLYSLNGLYKLQDAGGNILPKPSAGNIYVNPGLADTYGVNVGDILTLKIADRNCNFAVAEIAVNAKSASIYVNAGELSQIMGIAAGSYNGIWSMEQAPRGGRTIEKAQHIEELKRNAVSNSTSAVINQVIGSVVGFILIFLALYVNFQDNTRDMLILHLIGYRPKAIRKMLIDVYRPIVCIFFLISIIPSIFIARSIQRSLSITTNDYMPFGTSIVVILLVFVFLNIIYWLVQTMFSLGIKRTIKKETNL